MEQLCIRKVPGEAKDLRLLKTFSSKHFRKRFVKSYDARKIFFSGITFEETRHPIVPTMNIRNLICCFLAGLFVLITSFDEKKPASKKNSTGPKNLSTKAKPVKYPESPYRIVIDKSDYELHVYDEEGWLATYPIVFGNKKQDDKKMEGDRLTPEGTFHISFKKYHKEWGCFLLLDYPNPESYGKFNSRKASGSIPKSAKIGGGIGIHGTRPHEEYAVDKYMNWTNGCISVKYSDIFELYDLIPIGTEVVVQK
jgi:murein L,D-transpeptidase YafK